MRRICALALTMLLTACSALPTQRAAPEWVLNPPSDTATEFWGVGEGVDIDSATRAALRQIAARLRVSISSTVDNSLSVLQSSSGTSPSVQQSVIRSSQSRLQEVVRETEFTGVSLQQRAPSNNGVHVLVRVDRRTFVRETRNRLEQQRQRVQQSLDGLDTMDALTQYRTLQAQLPDIERALAFAQLLRVADGSASDAAITNRLEETRRQAHTAASRLSVRLQHEAVDTDVAAMLSEALTSEGFRIASAEKSPVMRITVLTRSEQLFDAWNCRMDVSLQWLNERGETVAARSHVANGIALESARRARQDAIRRLGLALRANSLPVALGLAQQ